MALNRLSLSPTLCTFIRSTLSPRNTPIYRHRGFRTMASSSTAPTATSSTRPARTSTKTIVILGSAYGGCRASKIISDSLPAGWKLAVIDRNTHFNHVYAFPRYTVLSKHAPIGYVPRTHDLDVPADLAKKEAAANGLPTPPLTPQSSSEDLRSKPSSSNREFIHASVVKLEANRVTFTRPGSYKAPAECSTATVGPSGHFEGPEETLDFDYAIYALGAALPDPTNPWSEHPNIPLDVVHDHVQHGLGSKKWGVKWMEKRAETFKKAERIVIVGAGALGIQFATDLKDVYPSKQVTLLHSRKRVMPIYPQEMHDLIIDGLKKLDVNVVLGERVTEWPDEPEKLNGKTKRVVTDKGSVFEADIVLPCTGQKAHSQYMAELCPDAVCPDTKRIRVLPTMQVSSNPENPRHTLERLAESFAKTSLSPPASPTTRSAASPSSPTTSTSTAETRPDLTHIFAIGDCADTGAIQAGHTAYWMGESAARNLLRLIAMREGRETDELEVYKYGKPAIKVTLGLVDAVISNAEGTTLNHEGKEDMGSRVIWDSHQAGHLPDDA